MCIANLKDLRAVRTVCTDDPMLRGTPSLPKLEKV